MGELRYYTAYLDIGTKLKRFEGNNLYFDV